MQTPAPLLLLLAALVGLALALPPFEIRSGPGAARSEGASQWLQHLHRTQPAGCHGDGGDRLCPSALPARRCIQTEQMCDGIPDCPEREDENPALCSFLRVNAKYRNGEI